MPLALLLLALGLALASAPRRAWLPSLLALLATSSTLGAVTFPKAWMEGVFLGCWISTVATAASVYLERRLRTGAALGLSINVAVWASAVSSVSESRSDLLQAVPCVLIFLPASWLVDRHVTVPIKVASSWLIAIALLAATLQILPVTPGYLPDHME
jgi:hypothetical protein